MQIYFEFISVPLEFRMNDDDVIDMRGNNFEDVKCVVHLQRM